MDEFARPWSRFLVKTIKKYQKHRGIKVEYFSGNWVIILSTDTKSTIVFGHSIGLNSASARLLARDKSATYQILNSVNIKSVPHFLLLKPGTIAAPGNVYELALNVFNKSNSKVVLKPNDGLSGEDVYLINNPAQLKNLMQQLFEKYRALTISPFFKIEKEYRVTILDSNVELIYEKYSPPSWKFNLSEGTKARVLPSTHSYYQTLSNIAKQAARSINITFANIDIVKVGNEFYLLEINSGVGFSKFAQQNPKHEKIAEQIYFKTLDKLLF